MGGVSFARLLTGSVCFELTRRIRRLSSFSRSTTFGYISGLIERRITLRAATVSVSIALQFLLTLACVLVLRQNTYLTELVEVYRRRSAPIVGRSVPTITGIDRTGVNRTVDYKQDQRPTLIYSFTERCPACQKNWAALRTIQSLSPTRLRIVYVNPYDQLTEGYLHEHGLARDVLFTKLDPLSAASFEVRGTPQTELVDNQGRVIWSSVGAFRPADLTALIDAIEEHEGESLETRKGAEQ